LALPWAGDNHTPLGFEKSASLCLPIARAQVTPKVVAYAEGPNAGFQGGQTKEV
jgi:hypothetical protein